MRIPCITAPLTGLDQFGLAAQPCARVTPNPSGELQRGQFRGWEVVAGCFVMAAITWGLCFYGIGVYLAYLVDQRGLPISAASGGVTVYFWCSAVLIMSCGHMIDRAGPRLSTGVGTLAMVLAVCAIGRARELWQFYAALGAMAVAWTTMTSSAINTILAPWFIRGQSSDCRNRTDLLCMWSAAVWLHA